MQTDAAGERPSPAARRRRCRCPADIVQRVDAGPLTFAAGARQIASLSVASPCRADVLGAIMGRRRTEREMRPHEFLLRVRELAEAQLPADAPRFQGRLRFNLIQLYREDPRIPYEVWHPRKTGHIA